MRRSLIPGLILALCLMVLADPALARGPRSERPDTFSTNELLDSGHNFFGNVSRGLALTIREAVRRWGEPDGYILGQEGSGAFFGGLRYGEGRLYRRRGPGERIFWQGPTLGFDVGGEGARTMMLVYNLDSVPDLYKRFAEIDGSAYLVAGVGLTAARADNTVVVPIRTGVGLRLGVNVGYLKFTDSPTWNPF
ncbi:DUF1134 domain-containing protein [Enterovirga sp. CN4-39]|uniref:DUF1134 domain-containing protein n=1 Tax=Enterovirga sp. CN4-39 TaxID=3400910 RepID=UPI003BFCAD3C